MIKKILLLMTTLLIWQPIYASYFLGTLQDCCEGSQFDGVRRLTLSGGIGRVFIQPEAKLNQKVIIATFNVPNDIASQWQVSVKKNHMTIKLKQPYHVIDGQYYFSLDDSPASNDFSRKRKFDCNGFVDNSNQLLCSIDASNKFVTTIRVPADITLNIQSMGTEQILINDKLYGNLMAKACSRSLIWAKNIYNCYSSFYAQDNGRIIVAEIISKEVECMLQNNSKITFRRGNINILSVDSDHQSEFVCTDGVTRLQAISKGLSKIIVDETEQTPNIKYHKKSKIDFSVKRVRTNESSDDYVFDQ